MKNIYYISLLTCLLISFSNSTWAQSENFASRSSLGFSVGGSYYIGDLNKYKHFQNTHLSGGLLYRYHVNSRLELRGGIRYGKVEGHDSNASTDIQQQRNISFNSDIFEVSAGLEFNYLNYKMGNDKFFFTPYLFLDIGVFKMDPKTEYNSEEIRLQPLGTEGQGSSLSDKKPYPLTQFVIPFGLGLKLNLGKRAAISFEYGLRKTFTDYLDDVGSGNYIPVEELAKENGNLSARLSDPSKGSSQMRGSRGNSSTKDWYSIFGVSFTFTLGNPSTCYY